MFQDLYSFTNYAIVSDDNKEKRTQDGKEIIFSSMIFYKVISIVCDNSYIETAVNKEKRTQNGKESIFRRRLILQRKLQKTGN